MLELYLWRLCTLSTARWTCRTCLNAHDRPSHKVSKRGSKKAADKALVQLQLCQITYEYHMLLWSRRTFDPSLDLLDQVVCGNIFQVGGRHCPRRHSPEGAPPAATKQCRKPHRLQIGLLDVQIICPAAQRMGTHACMGHDFGLKTCPRPAVNNRDRHVRVVDYQGALALSLQEIKTSFPPREAGMPPCLR